MQHGTSEVASSEGGLLFETVCLANGRSFTRPAFWLRSLPVVGPRYFDTWWEGREVPGTKAEKRARAREPES